MQARVVARVVLLLAAAGMVTGVPASDAYAPPTSDAFLKSIRSYPFVDVAARREKIRTGVPQLTRCMPSTGVRRLIGDPDLVWFDGNGNLQTVTVHGAPDIEASISRRNEECP